MSKPLLREILSTLDSEYSLPYFLKQKIESELAKPKPPARKPLSDVTHV
jgi:hypothetical protein